MQHPEIGIKWLGPVTMHRVGRDKMKFTVPRDGVVVFCFGEIDVRCHVHNQVMSGRSEDEVLEKLVNEYAKALEENAYPKYMVMNVVPPVRVSEATENPELPFIGSDEDRARYTRKINDLISKRFVNVLDIYSMYKDDDGMLPRKWSDGIVHINDDGRIVELIDEVKRRMK